MKQKKAVTSTKPEIAQNSDVWLDRFDAIKSRSIRRALETWYAKAGRSLPWRETHDPYRIWISEIMLQQTTVKAVIPYFEKFLNRFPTVESLANASEAEVLAYWEGLGYYSRGRNLRLAAQQIMQHHRGEFPRELPELLKLPGIGRYTAGAIRSFAFDLPTPIVEANTLRLYCRLLGFTGDPRSSTGQSLLWKFAEQLQPAQKAGHLNQALMELGGMICTPLEPDCERCPVRKHCAAFLEGRQTEIPLPKVRPEVTQTVEATIAIHNGNRFLIRQRTSKERWAGMWDFLRYPIESVKPAEKLTKRALTKVHRELGTYTLELNGELAVNSPELVKEIRHTVTRYRIRLLCFVQEFSSTGRESEVCGVKTSGDVEAEMKWTTLKELQSLPMPVTGRQFAELLMERYQ